MNSRRFSRDDAAAAAGTLVAAFAACTLLNIFMPGRTRSRSVNSRAFTRHGQISTHSIPLGDLLARGYPPRPDPKQDPERYSEWVKRVTTPIDLYSPTLVTRLGKSGGLFKGAKTNIWSGFVQAGAGFDSNLVVNSASPLYELYWFTTNAPGSGCFPPGDSIGCDTLLWGGIGGVFFNAWYGLDQSELIQSGFEMLGNPYSPMLFVEYTPAPVVNVLPPGPDVFAAGDVFDVYGWSSNSSSCATPDVSGQWACFAFDDISSSTPWGFLPAPILTTGGRFVPVSTDYVVEWPATGGVQTHNAFYWPATMTGGAWDYPSGNYHADPSSGADPYIVYQQNGSSGNPVNKATWSNGSYDTPQYPMTFTWKAWN